MKTFDIKKFEENKGKQGYINEYHYKLNDGSEVKEYITKENNEEMYMQEIRKEFNPYRYVYMYYANGTLYTSSSFFNNSHINIFRVYDKNGKVIKEIDDDKDFKYTFEQIHDIVLKEKGIDIYDTRQAITLRHNTPNAIIKKYYQIHVLKSELVQGVWYSQPNYSFLIDDETGEILTQEDIDNKNKSSSIYRTHEGKNYTQSEWEAYEEKQYEEYCKRTGRPYTPKNQRTNTSDQDNRKSFLANDEEKGDNNTPNKNKGFLGGFFS